LADTIDFVEGEKMLIHARDIVEHELPGKEYKVRKHSRRSRGSSSEPNPIKFSKRDSSFSYD